MNVSWKTVRVFISSTFRDMQAERDHLVRFVFPLLREELVKYRIHLVDVDLRWGVTGEQDALGACFEVIDECEPRFMGILGGRYGWVPSGRDNSITADEIHYGVLGREAEKRGHAVFYFRADSVTARMVEEAPGDFREPVGSENATKLAALKKSIVDAELPVFIYSAVWDAAHKQLTGLIEFGDKVHADLLQSLKNDPKFAARFTEKTTPPLDEFVEEADQMEAFIEERTDSFVIGSRDPLMRDLLAFVDADPEVTGPSIFVLIGESGSGKSAFLAKFTRELAGLHPSFFLLPTFVGASTGSTDLRRTLRRLCHELARSADNTAPLPHDINELITHFHALLAEVAGRQRVILVFDALNQFDASDGAHWLNWLPQNKGLPPGVRIIASVIAPTDSQPEHPTLSILRTRTDTCVEKLLALTETDILAIIKGRLRRYSKRLSSEQIAALLAKSAGRLPLYVLTALEELRTLGTYEEITERIRALPGDTRMLFGWILTERLARDSGFRDRNGRPCGAKLVGKFVTCLSVSRHGLSPVELTALLDRGDPLGNVAALLRLLRPYLMWRGEQLDFYHSQFREAASTNYGNEMNLIHAHREISDYFHLLSDPENNQTWKGAFPRPFQELVFHLVGAQSWQQVKSALCSPKYISRWFTLLTIEDLQMDYQLASSAMPDLKDADLLRVVGASVVLEAPAISRFPNLIIPILVNACKWVANDQLQDLVQKWKILIRQQRLGWLERLNPPQEIPGLSPIDRVFSYRSRCSALAFSDDGKSLAVAESVGVALLDVKSGKVIRLMKLPQLINGGIKEISWSPDGHWIAAIGHLEGYLAIWDTSSGIIRFFEKVHTRGCSVMFCAKGLKDPIFDWDLLSCGDESFSLWFVNPESQQFLFEGLSSGKLDMLRRDRGEDPFCDESFKGGVWARMDGKSCLVFGTQSGQLLVSNLSGRRIAKLPLGPTIHHVSTSENGRYVAIVANSDELNPQFNRIGNNHMVVVIDQQRGAAIGGFHFKGHGGKASLLSKKNEMLVFELDHGRIFLFKLDPFERAGEWQGPSIGISAGCVGPDMRIAVATNLGEVLLLNRSRIRSLENAAGNGRCVWNLAFSPSGQEIAAASVGHYLTSDFTGEMRLFSVDTGNFETIVTFYGNSREGALCISYMEDGRIVTGHLDGSLRTWSPSGELVSQKMIRQSAGIGSLFYCSHNKLAIFTSGSWYDRRDEGRKVHVLATGEDEAICLGEIGTGRYTGGQPGVPFAFGSSDGYNVILAVGEDLCAWKTCGNGEWKEWKRVKNDFGPICAVGWSRFLDSFVLSFWGSESENGLLFFLPAKSLAFNCDTLSSLLEGCLLAGKGGSVPANPFIMSLCLSECGRYMAFASFDKVCRIARISEDNTIEILAEHPLQHVSEIWSTAVSPSGTEFAFGDANGDIHWFHFNDIT